MWLDSLLFLNISNESLQLKLSLFSYVFMSFFYDSAAAIVHVKDNNATAVSENVFLSV